VELIGSIDPTDGNIYPQYNAGCTYNIITTDCWPAPTPSRTLTAPAFTGITEEDFEKYLESKRQYETPYGAYFSLGLYCLLILYPEGNNLALRCATHHG
jgi:hypothetical protein